MRESVRLSDEQRLRRDLINHFGGASAADLVRLSGAKPGIERSALLELEIACRLERHGGGLVSLV